MKFYPKSPLTKLKFTRALVLSSLASALVITSLTGCVSNLQRESQMSPASNLSLADFSGARILVVGDVHLPAAIAKNSERFNSIASALIALEKAPIDEHAIIFLGAGDYFEKLNITKNNLRVVGAGAGKTRILFDDYAGRQIPGGDNGQTLGTSGSATITVGAEKIRFQHLSIVNSFDMPKVEELPDGDPQKISGTQAVALYLKAEADKVRLDNVRLEGYQDTLYSDAKRAYVANSFISGHVDFIFGRGNLLIENSEIQTRNRAQADIYPHSFITAASTKVDQPFGITFLNCKLTRESGVPDNAVALGRPWHPTTTFSDGRYADPFAKGKVIFANTWMDSHILKDGWYWMGGTAKDGSKVPMLPENARFSEFNSVGPGAALGPKRWQLLEQEKPLLSRAKILGDWIVAD